MDLFENAIPDKEQMSRKTAEINDLYFKELLMELELSWPEIELVLQSSTGRIYVSDKRKLLSDKVVFLAVLYYVAKGISWRELPKVFGSYTAINQRFTRWREAGVFCKLIAEGVISHSKASVLCRKRAKNSNSIQNKREYEYPEYCPKCSVEISNAIKAEKKAKKAAIRKAEKAVKESERKAERKANVDYYIAQGMRPRRKRQEPEEDSILSAEKEMLAFENIYDNLDEWYKQMVEAQPLDLDSIDGEISAVEDMEARTEEELAEWEAEKLAKLENELLLRGLYKTRKIM